MLPLRCYSLVTLRMAAWETRKAGRVYGQAIGGTGTRAGAA
ncbi:MAG: hypothetical protein ACRDQ7_20990 [Haloechinothrix sp.]